MPDFVLNEPVLCMHGSSLFEAKVVEVKLRAGLETLYLVHYIGWKKNWDETVPEQRLRKRTQENLEVKERIAAEIAATKGTKRKVPEPSESSAAPTKPAAHRKKTAADSQASRDARELIQVKKTLQTLLAKVERVSSAKPPRHRAPKTSVSRPAAGADAAGGNQASGSADAQAKRPGRPRAAVKSAVEIMREPLSAFMLFGLEQHSLDPPAPTADPRELAKGYGEEWLKLSQEARLPWEQMAEGLEPPRCKRMAEDKAKKTLAGGKGSTGGKVKVAVDDYAPTFSDSAQRRAGKSTVDSTSPQPAAPLFGDEPAHPVDDFDDELEGDEPELPSGDGDAMDADADAMEE
ncbi:hypothetical protein T492DRAFT_988921 [Pavlovales sp. CCMP2436]|nr:hypothetical protein T492DRAFT_988921 [Pavlovales sp. CCMP2436]